MDLPSSSSDNNAAPSGKKSNLRKSNSRVSSTGKLRLKVESFRNSTNNNNTTNSNKNTSSGTQTDISVLKKAPAPSKPARKTKKVWSETIFWNEFIDLPARPMIDPSIKRTLFYSVLPIQLDSGSSQDLCHLHLLF